MICRYQLILAGQWRHRRNGVNILTKSKRVCQPIQNRRGDLTRLVAENSELELMKPPLARADNFSKAFQGHTVKIEHTEDGGQIMRSKSGKADPGEAKERTPAAKRQLASTEADLRSLTAPALREKPISLGVPPSEISNMTRWKQVELIKKLARRSRCR
jgi:hypothetical protein